MASQAAASAGCRGTDMRDRARRRAGRPSLTWRCVESKRRRRLARPQHDVAAGAAHGLRQRRAPGAAADDADIVDLHANFPGPPLESPARYLARLGLMPSRRHRSPGRHWRRAASAGARARRADRSCPSARRSAPAQAIIAALSLHRADRRHMEREAACLAAKLAGWRAGACWRRRRPRPRTGGAWRCPARSA